MEDTMVKVSAEDCVQVGNEIIFICREFNMICALDLDNGDIRIIGSLPEESLFAERLGSKIIYWRDELIFIPMKAKKIWRYNLKTGEWKGYERKDLGDGMTGNEMFQAVLYENVIFIIGANYPAIIKLDLITEKLIYIEEPYRVLFEKQKEIRDCFFRTDCVQINEKIYIASALDNLVLLFDMKTLNYSWIRVGKEGNRYSGITWDGKNFWLAPRCNTSIVKWDGKNVTEYELPVKFHEKELSFLGAYYKDNLIVFPSMTKKCTLLMDIENDYEFEIIEESFFFYNNINTNINVSISKNNILKIHNDKNKFYNLCISRNVVHKYLKERKQYDDMVHTMFQENVFIGIKEYLELI